MTEHQRFLELFDALFVPSHEWLDVTPAAWVGPDGNRYVSGNDKIIHRDRVSAAVLKMFEPSPTSTVGSPPTSHCHGAGP